MTTLRTELKEAMAQSVSVSDDALVVDLADGRTITVPLAWFPRLVHGTAAARTNWRLIGSGEGIHWPDLDEDISVESLLAGRRSGETQESLRRWLKTREAIEGYSMRSSSDAEAALPDDVPSEVREEIVRDLGNFAVAIFGVAGSSGDQRLHFAGSGTLVAVADSHYILTAAHVWMALRSYHKIGITLKEREDHSFFMPTDAIADTTLGPGQPAEWGPDLSILRVPPAYAGKIKAYRTFYNLTKHRQTAVDFDRMETWVLMGAAAAYGEFTTTHADLQIAGHFSQVDARHRRDGFDYLDVGVNLSLPDVPNSFGGLSGGGLWQVLIWKPASTGQFKWDRALEGVAFYESAAADGRRIIRCHGRQSITEHLPQITG